MPLSVLRRSVLLMQTTPVCHQPWHFGVSLPSSAGHGGVVRQQVGSGGHGMGSNPRYSTFCFVTRKIFALIFVFKRIGVPVDS